MKILIERQGDNIIVAKDFEDVESRGEVTQINMELDYLKEELLALYLEMSKWQNLK